jgi:Cu/Ag efflux protein CusF
MTMEFDLRDASLAKGLAVGDAIQFTFTDEGRGRLVVQRIEKAR